jgi:5-(carboxyamino)imidazole ribonucleotide synthase
MDKIDPCVEDDVWDTMARSVVDSEIDLIAELKTRNKDEMILEEFISFERELSLIGVRTKRGETRFYPLVENHHREGILRLSLVMGNVSPDLQKQAEEYTVKVMFALDYVGVLTIEFLRRTVAASVRWHRAHNSDIGRSKVQ